MGVVERDVILLRMMQQRITYCTRFRICRNSFKDHSAYLIKIKILGSSTGASQQNKSSLQLVSKVKEVNKNKLAMTPSSRITRNDHF